MRPTRALRGLFSKAEKPFHDPWHRREAWRYEAPFKPNDRLFGCVPPPSWLARSLPGPPCGPRRSTDAPSALDPPARYQTMWKPTLAVLAVYWTFDEVVKCVFSPLLLLRPPPGCPPLPSRSRAQADTPLPLVPRARSHGPLKEVVWGKDEAHAEGEHH